ncbi:MAG: DJ-1/PfpI family protein, partial [Acetanaerobacterium sp.]
VEWQRRARWVVDGKYYTSSGVSAGMDMTLGFVADYLDMEQAYTIANYLEYIWNPDCGDDPFAV